MWTKSIALLVTAALLSACGNGDGKKGGSAQLPDPSLGPDSFFDPEEPAPSCGYGYGEPCPEPAVDCAQDPCIHGTCISSPTSSSADFCLCDEGYQGTFCTSCKTGWKPEGLICVFIDPCREGPCVFGTCRPTPNDFSCDCRTGYAGKLCDRCAPGYHVEALQCVPD